jgi:alkyl hydroperoxide reductase subunit F
MKKLTFYLTEGCPFCLKAKSFLEEKGIDYDEVKVLPGSKELSEMASKTGASSLPQFMVDEEALGGYSDLVHLDATGELAGKLELPPKEGAAELYDLIIIGAGPAGLSAAIYAARKLIKTMLISQNIGGQVTETWDIENYLGFSQIETSDLIKKFQEHVEKFGIYHENDSSVIDVDFSGKVKKVTTENGKTYQSKTLIIATGKRWRLLNVPGEKELSGRGVAYCSTCDAPLFAEANVAVVGGGNSALEAVIDLMKIAKKVYLVSLTMLTADQVYQEKTLNASNVEVLTEYETLKIFGESEVEGLEVRSLGNGEKRRLDVEGVFIEIGLLPNSELFIDTLQINKFGEIEVDERCRTGLAGVFACGDVTNVPYKQVIIAAGEGAKAALAANEYLLNQR